MPDIMDGMLTADTGIFYGGMPGGCGARGAGCGDVFGSCDVCADYGGGKVFAGNADYLDYGQAV